MEELEQKFYQKYARTNEDAIRDFASVIDWSDRLIGIKGGRGVGKTTMILQHIKKNYKPDGKALYISLDNLYFSENSFYRLADEFHRKGGVFLAVDEVHRYPNWATEMKNIYDDMPDLKLVFTGSSLLHLHKAKADLSRRAVMYSMPGLSFREFLGFETGQMFEKCTLDELIGNHTELAINVASKIKPLAYFDAYLNHGYYPFYLENKTSFHQKLSETVLAVLEVDITQFASVQVSNIIYLKKLLQIISNSVPFKPNMNALSQRTGISLNTMKIYLGLLSDAELLQLLHVKGKGMNSLNRPEKIYLGNTNLIYNLGDGNLGNVRETFFLQQTRISNMVAASPSADFLVNDKYTFEVGGKGKTSKQISGVKHSYLVKDDIEIGSGNTIPLWMFGMLY